MSIVQQFNGLNGCTVSRKQVRDMIAEADRQEQYQLSDRLTKVLNSHKDKSLTFKITQPAIEVVPESFLHCLECVHDNDDKIVGLGKAVSPNEIYQMITDRMIQQIEKAKGGYVQEWKGGVYGKGYLIPFNFITKKAYRGINRFLLTGLKPLENPFFMTFKQVGELGGKVKKGAKGYEVVYFTQLYRYVDTAQKINVASYDIKKFIAMIERLRHKIARLSGGMSLEAFARLNALPILKYYNVYNGKDVEGIDFKLADFKHGYIENERPATEGNRLQIAEAIIKHYPTPQPKLKHGGDQAYYSPKSDTVQLPHFADFKTVQGYYTTAFHEYAHSTGHSSRLARDFGGTFGSKKYAFEELIAEFGATFLSAEAGLLWHTNDNHAKYLKNWNSVLTHLQEDNRFLMRAATQAQALCDFVLDNDDAGNPAYFQDIKPKATMEKAPKAGKKTATPSKPIATRKKRKNIDPAQTTMALNGRKKAVAKGLAMPVAMPCETPTVKEIIAPPIVNTLPVPVIETPAPRKISGAVSSNELMSMHFESLKFDGEWADFMQEPAKNMKIAIWGKPKNGKTSGAAKFANYLTRFGNVLYNFVDQGFNKSTQDIWKNSGLADNDNAFAANARTLEELDKLIASGEYQFVFIDMINNYIDLTKIKPFEFKERYITKYPDVSFILVFEVTKGGDFKGDQGWTHVVDALVTVEDFLMENRGRYGVGHHIIWEDGFKKFNPKKYEELMAEAAPEPVATPPASPGESLKFRTI